jgi:3-oxoacyl-[acyl-carrier protein] reductase
MTDYALVTGAARNIGRAIATRLKADGYNVLMLDRMDPEDPSLGDFRKVDLSDPTDTAQALAWALDGRRITRVVNCAGIVSTAKIEDVAMEDYERVMAVNVRSYIEVMKALVPQMKEAGFGRVVNIASRAALGYANLTVYSASKAAVVGLTKTWAQELARLAIFTTLPKPASFICGTSAFITSM